MNKKSLIAAFLNKASIVIVIFVLFSCKKETNAGQESQLIKDEILATSVNANAGESNYNLEVVLRGEGNRSGHIHFRQSAAKIITLDTKVHNLLPNHAYKLQRAVDTNIDGNCTGTSWLTLGKGSTPHSIFTDNNGNATEELWRDLSAVASGSTFDIHFRVIDAATSSVVLASDCYQFTVR